MGGQQHLSNSSMRKRKNFKKKNSSRKEEMAFSQCETKISFKLLMFLVSLNTEY